MIYAGIIHVICVVTVGVAVVILVGVAIVIWVREILLQRTVVFCRHLETSDRGLKVYFLWKEPRGTNEDVGFYRKRETCTGRERENLTPGKGESTVM